jgi:hypothetical protein
MKREHKFVLTVIVPVTQQEVASGHIEFTDTMLDSRPTTIQVYCCECRLTAEQAIHLSCPGDPVGFGEDGTPIHVPRN